MVKLHSRILIVFFSRDCHEFSDTDHAFEKDDHVFEGDDHKFPDDQCFCGDVPDVDGDSDILKIYLRAKNE